MATSAPTACVCLGQVRSLSHAASRTPHARAQVHTTIASCSSPPPSPAGVSDQRDGPGVLVTPGGLTSGHGFIRLPMLAATISSVHLHDAISRLMRRAVAAKMPCVPGFLGCCRGALQNWRDPHCFLPESQPSHLRAPSARAPDCEVCGSQPVAPDCNTRARIH